MSIKRRRHDSLSTIEFLETYLTESECKELVPLFIGESTMLFNVPIVLNLEFNGSLEKFFVLLNFLNLATGLKHSEFFDTIQDRLRCLIAKYI